LTLSVITPAPGRPFANTLEIRWDPTFRHYDTINVKTFSRLLLRKSVNLKSIGFANNPEMHHRQDRARASE